MHYLAEYGLFLAKILTVVIALIIIMVVAVSLTMKNKEEQKGQLSIKKINKKFEEMREVILHEVLSKKAFKTWHKKQKQAHKSAETSTKIRRRVYVLDFNGDVKASALENLREEITGILSIAEPKDEIIVRLESSGGMVHSYGLASSQLQRIREKNIPLTIIIDKVAASGGYMMACVGNKIFAAPFAIIGSIGVIAQLPNFHRLLQKNQVDFEQVMSGEYKRTLSLFGPITEQGRAKIQEEVEEIHHYFKEFIHQNRAQVNIDQVATGETWPAVKAMTLNLVDGLTTSDDYLYSASQEADIYQVKYIIKKSIGFRLTNYLQERHQAMGVNYLFK